MPQFVHVESCPVTVSKLSNHAGILSTINSNQFIKESYEKSSNTGTGLIFFIDGCSFSLIWSKLAIFLFDSHSRSSGSFITLNGTSVLLKFKTIDEVQNYITDVYLLHQNLETLLYQMQYISIEARKSDINTITLLNGQKREKESENNLETVNMRK